MSIVTLEQVKEHLRYDDTSNDVALTGYIAAAESAVLNYITDTFADDAYPDGIKHAVLILVGYFDQYRNAEAETPLNGVYLPLPVQSLLYPYRTPTAI